MAKDEQGEKTEQPTRKRRQDSREKGQVAKSQDLTGSVMMLVACTVLYVFGPWMAGRIVRSCVYLFSHMDSIEISMQTTNAHTAAGGVMIAATVAPLLAALFVTSGVMTVMQVGFKFSGKPFELDVTRFDPIKGIGRLFSFRAAMKLITGIMKIGSVALVVGFALHAELPKILALMKNMSTRGNPTPRVAAYITEQAILLGIYSSFVLVVISLLDYAYQRWQHTQDLKMTKQEVKEEMRNMEGDPQIKKRRLEVQRRVAQGRMMHDASQADVMVTNPTHYTVALTYQREEAVPRVVAKGADLLALKLRELAKENDIPLVEKPELARALYRLVDVGDTVPEAHWKAVAQVLAFIWGKDEQKKQELLREVGGA